MEQKYLIFLLGFDVTLLDRRNGEIKKESIVIPYPEEHPDDLEDAREKIRSFFGNLGYSIKEIKHKASRVMELELQEEFVKARNTTEYEG